VKKLIVFSLLIAVVMSTLPLSALAEESKVKRVGKNTLLGWTEIPKAITSVTKETDNPFLGITVGLLKGVANTFSRTASGVADVVTLPAKNQEPIIKEQMIDIGTKQDTTTVR